MQIIKNDIKYEHSFPREVMRISEYGKSALRVEELNKEIKELDKQIEDSDRHIESLRR